MSKLREYSLYLYFRQGDDLRHYLSECDGNVSKALASLGADLKAAYETCNWLSLAMAKHNVVAHAEGHHISFEAVDEKAEGLLETLVKEKVLNIYEIEEEEYGEDDEYEGDEDDEYEGDEDDDGEEESSKLNNKI